jgi:hypothetical protein
MLVRSPTLTNSVSSVTVTGSRPDSRSAGAPRPASAAPALDRAGDRRDVRGRRAAAAADEVDEAAVGELREDAAVSSGDSSYSPNALGSPAFG